MLVHHLLLGAAGGMLDFTFIFGCTGLAVSLIFMCVGVRRMDDVWHSRRAWAPRLILTGLLLLTGAIAALFCSPLVQHFFS